MLLVILAALAVLGIYMRIIRPMYYWKLKGIQYAEPVFLFGNVYKNTVQKQSLGDLIGGIYEKYKHLRYVGWYQFTRPILMVNDIELIKTIGIKDFDHFTDHAGFSSMEIDPLWSKNLFASKGNNWRDMRATLSPSFTGSKMKMMFNLIADCSEQFIQYFTDQNEEIISVEMKDIFTRVTNDVIATCAFGIQCNSLKEQENEFFVNGRDATNFVGLNSLKFFAYQISPTLTKLFNIKVIATKPGNFFRNVVSDAIKVREEKQVFRPDMIQLLLEARNERKKNNPHQKHLISDEDITAQALIFFFAGFDTSSTVMMYITYELAVNKEIQNRLRDEINQTLKECNGKITYDVLMKMKYMDMVVSEVLRKWPPTPTTDRICTSPYTIEPERADEKPLTLDVGTTLWFPIFGIHRNPEYFPDPEKFDPERFSDENKSKILPATYIPFGLGPRNCIGTRFGLMENKIVIFYILSKFEIVPVDKTPIPLVLSKKHFNMQPEGGMWLGLKKLK